MSKFIKVSAMEKYANPLLAIVTKVLPMITGNPQLMKALATKFPGLNILNSGDILNQFVKELSNPASDLWDFIASVIAHYQFTASDKYKEKNFYSPQAYYEAFNAPGAALPGMSPSQMPKQMEGGYGSEGGKLLSSSSSKFVKISQVPQSQSDDVMKNYQSLLTANLPDITSEQFMQRVKAIGQTPLLDKVSKDFMLNQYITSIDEKMKKFRQNILIPAKQIVKR
jgi:hypothetical protein